MRAFPVLFALLIVSVCAEAQVDAWSRVERLPAGTRLLVTTSHTAPCTLRSAGAEGMECLFHGGVFWVDRERIAQVERAPHGKSIWVGTLVGAAAGGSLAAARDDPSDTDKAVTVVIGTGLGGWLGNAVGHLFVRREGIVIYENPFSQP